MLASPRSPGGNVTRTPVRDERLGYIESLARGHNNHTMLSHSADAVPEGALSHSGRGSLRLTLAASIAALCIPQIADAAANEFRVLHHQAVQIQSQAQVGAAEHVSFEAYGRRFELSLMPNERIRRAMSDDKSETMPLEGTLDGVSASWVRLTRSVSGWRGMFFDGDDLYAIEPASDIAGATVQPMDASGSEPVIYRLDDAVLPPEQMSCEIVEPETTTAAESFEQLGRELHAQAASAELVTAKQVRVGVVGDFEFVGQFSGTTTPEDAIVARMNIVDGIFMSQLGVKLSLAPFTLFRTASDPFSKTKASDLLTELRNYRQGSAAQLASGLSHLMTGKDLDGDTVGIAFIGSVCDGSNASSLSEGRRTTTQSALIAAHEIGHNFGAPHDGETGSSCASTPQTFLMAPRLNGSDQFSACSVEKIQPIVNNARCLTAYVPPDAGLVVNSSQLQATVNSALVVSFVVRALGDDASTNVSVSATVPANVTIQSVTANGGSCTTGAGMATCTFGTLAAGDTRQVDMSLTPTESGTVSVNLALSAANDGNGANNSGSISIVASGSPGPTPPPPATGGSSDNGGGGGRLDLLLLGLLLVATYLKMTRRSFASTFCLGRARTSEISPSVSDRTAVSIFIASRVTSKSPRDTF